MHQRTAVILDPQPLWLEAVQGVLHKLGFQVVGKATDPADAYSLVEERSPDVVVAEVAGESDEYDGLSFLARVRDRSPDTRVVVLSVDHRLEVVDATIAAGAVAYVIKSVHPDDLASAIRQVFDHSIYFAYSSPARVETNATANGNGSLNGDAPHPTAPAERHGLTRRELEILRLVSEGHSNAELARQLWVTEQTIKFHLSNIYRKLDVANRTEASRWAQLNGLLLPRPVAEAV
jgi:DNA-binding NarL/FixJ family response regulator